MNGLILCTKECNLRCKYCFEESMHQDECTPVSKIRRDFEYFLDHYFDTFIQELIAINKEMNRKETDITFHGGEPLLIGYDLLKKGFDMVRKYPDTIIAIQTNGTLITDEIIQLFVDYKVRVGISIDGPKYMHDAYRRNVAGHGSFDKIFENIQKMRQAGVLVGALATVTDITVKHPEDFYGFFRDLNLDFSFNPCFTDPNLPSTYNVLNMGEFIEFYKKMFDLWINDNEGKIYISCFERIISAMGIKKKPWMEVCSYIPDCSRTTVAINTEGEFYRCLHYCMDSKHRIGRIPEDPLCKAVGDPQISARWDCLKAGECKDCDIQEYCCGGCPYVAETVNGTMMSRANTCMSQKAIVHYIYDYLSQFVVEK